MSKDQFRERGRALEDEFFRRVDEELAAELKSKLGAEIQIKALGEATGFSDQKLLQELVDLGLSPQTVLAISLVPLVLVAWADGKVDQNERPAIMAEAKEQGITDGSPAARMLKHWLNSEPDSKLGAAWIHYIQTIYDDMEQESRDAMLRDFDHRTRAIAKSSGGVLGFGKISEVEQSVIDDLRQVF